MDTEKSLAAAKSHRHLYSSLQYNLPFWMAAKVIGWGRENVPDEILFEDPEDRSYGRELEVHCTVFYGIHTTGFAPVRELAGCEAGFPITLGPISVFSNCKFDVVKIEAFGEDLFRLHEKIGRALECTETYRYNPHVTIAYIQKGLGGRYVGDRAFCGQQLWVNSLKFSSRDGSEYHFPLQHRVPAALFRKKTG